MGYIKLNNDADGNSYELIPSDGIAHLEAGAGATPSTLAITYVGGYAAGARTITLTFTNGAAAFTDAASLKDPVWDAIKKSAQAPGSTPVVTGLVDNAGADVYLASSAIS